MRFVILILLAFSANCIFSQNIEKIIRKGERKIRVVKSKKAKQEKKDKALNEVYAFYTKELINYPNLINHKDFKTSIDTLLSLFSSRCVEIYNKAKKTMDKDDYEYAALRLLQTIKLDSLIYTDSDTSSKRSIMTYYVAIMFKEAKNYINAQKYYNLCITNEYENSSPYAGLASLYKKIGDKDNELKIAKAGYEKYPKSEHIIYSLINYYITAQDNKNALIYLSKAIEINPGNHSLYYAIGTIYDGMSKEKNKEEKEYEQKALKFYSKALKLKPDYFEALYNIGALYYNKAAFVLQKAHEIPINDAKRYTEEVKRADKLFEKSLPYMEKAYLVDKEDKTVVQVLVTLYQKLKLFNQKKMAQKIMDGEKTIKIVPVSDTENLIYMKKK